MQVLSSARASSRPAQEAKDHQQRSSGGRTAATALCRVQLLSGSGDRVAVHGSTAAVHCSASRATVALPSTGRPCQLSPPSHVAALFQFNGHI